MAQVRQAIALLNLLLVHPVNLVVLVVLVRQAPLVAGEHAAGLQHLEDLAVHAAPLGSMASSLDGVDPVEALLGKLGGKLHEVSLHRAACLVEPLRLAQRVGAVDLVLVDRDPGDVPLGVPGDVAVGAADAATDVENLGARGESQEACQVVLVAADALHEALAEHAVREVEGRAPPDLVEERRELVVVVDERGIVAVPLRRVLGGVQLVVLLDPVLDHDLPLLLLPQPRADKVRDARHRPVAVGPVGQVLQEVCPEHHDGCGGGARGDLDIGGGGRHRRDGDWDLVDVLEVAAGRAGDPEGRL
mmetsp:Transcript_22902/g.44526  ORF Transcript_22902/g.44526 Transcript_22902/m.44526 type:complete len:303 (-) Transcript_22902:55-963(-)